MWPNPQETPDLVTFTEEILNETLHFLCSKTCFTMREFMKYLFDEIIWAYLNLDYNWIISLVCDMMLIKVDVQ